LAQTSGSSAEVWYKVEVTNGVVPTATVGGGASTTLSAAANPGDTSITVASDTNIAAGDVLKVGGNDNMELVRVDSGYSSGTTVTLESGSKINLRHESAEAVLEVTVNSGWFKLGNITAFTPTGERSLQLSNALSGTRVLSNFREGNYEAGIDLTAEVDLVNCGVLFAHALSNDYYSAGTTQPTTPVNTTLSSAAAIADTSIEVASATNVETGVFLLLSTGTSAEVVKIGTYTSGTTLDLDTTAHPNGLRKAHSSGAAVVEKIAPFTHTVTRGNNIGVGLTFLLRFTDIDSDLLVRGNRISSLTYNVTTDSLPTVSVSTVAKAFQLFNLSDAETIWGTATTIDNNPYVHHEGVVTVAGSSLSENKFEDLSFTIENTIQGNFVVGSPLRGAITPGDGNSSGTFNYQFETPTFEEDTIVGTEKAVKFALTYQSNSNHSLSFEVHKAKFQGSPPGVPGKDPVVPSKSFQGRLDTSQDPDTDVTVIMKNKQVNLEFPTETQT